MRTFLIFYFIIQFSFSQTNTICLYQVAEIQDSLKEKRDETTTSKDSKKILKQALEISKKFTYSLRFNENESIFLKEKKMNNDKENTYVLGIANSFIGTGVYYQNKKENISLLEKQTFGKDFLIKSKLKKENEWRITNEQKKIGKLLCFKAIRICKSCSVAEEVWFTPDIPVPFGPMGYGGFPGLVVEVKNNNILILRLTKVNFLKGQSNIEKPTKGEILSKKQYDDKIMEIRAKNF
ncbi:GLPGLI family protein [Polaribacter sargassicola]|uniref:GLPGLI family protein n=1 Tax=Polaribacter sargassicola TaxID=2836891 RepID=UPI001F2A33D9|nr:GLPGLI family protein [Polaribacter sp. DS7-9]MCG1035147.1 GLPGLI family protein [Polaribacter sp. DS7-9]